MSDNNDKVVGLNGKALTEMPAIDAGLLDLARNLLAGVESGVVTGVGIITLSKPDHDKPEVVDVDWSGDVLSLLGGFARAQYMLNQDLDITEGDIS